MLQDASQSEKVSRGVKVTGERRVTPDFHPGDPSLCPTKHHQSFSEPKYMALDLKPNLSSRVCVCVCSHQSWRKRGWLRHRSAVPFNVRIRIVVPIVAKPVGRLEVHKRKFPECTPGHNRAHGPLETKIQRVPSFHRCGFPGLLPGRAAG